MNPIHSQLTIHHTPHHASPMIVPYRTHRPPAERRHLPETLLVLRQRPPHVPHFLPSQPIPIPKIPHRSASHHFPYLPRPVHTPLHVHRIVEVVESHRRIHPHVRRHQPQIPARHRPCYFLHHRRHRQVQRRRSHEHRVGQGRREEGNHVGGCLYVSARVCTVQRREDGELRGYPIEKGTASARFHSEEEAEGFQWLQHTESLRRFRVTWRDGSRGRSEKDSLYACIYSDSDVRRSGIRQKICRAVSSSRAIKARVCEEFVIRSAVESSVNGAASAKNASASIGDAVFGDEGLGGGVVGVGAGEGGQEAFLGHDIGSGGQGAAGGSTADDDVVVIVLGREIAGVEDEPHVTGV
ncbi:hypothetical protein G2W53_000063 [Senna tora]|uniref:Uncharacterized protein n=1 Tax=Senna tora TaxID=362788 RepID=A0A834XCT4_9FABA|nr:hypothetical protein G2W53_000063 [Senna tora]